MPSNKRKLKVTGQKPITNITLRNGGSTTLFEVFAVTEDGGYVEEALRAFQELDKGQLIEYTIEPYNHPRHGMSYTLYPPKPETARRLRELEETTGALVRWAESQGFELAKWKQPDAPPPKPEEGAEAEAKAREADQQAEAAMDEAGEKFGEEAPWGSLDEELEQHAQTGSTDPPPPEAGLEL